MTFTEDNLRDLGEEVYKVYENWRASYSGVATVDNFLKSDDGKVFYELLWNKVIGSKERNYAQALEDKEFAPHLLQLNNMVFLNEKGEPCSDQVQEYALLYRLAQNETYMDCIDADDCNQYNQKLSNNVDGLCYELILNQLIFEKLGDIKYCDLKNIPAHQLKKWQSEFAERIEKIRRGEEKIKITPEVAAATYTVHNEKIGSFAESRNLSELKNIYETFDDTLYKKYPKAYPIIKNVLINGGAALAGPVGLAAVSAVRTYAAVKNLKKEAEAKGYGSLWNYIGENKAAAVGLGFKFLGTALTVCSGVDAAFVGNFGIISQGAQNFTTSAGIRYGKLVASLGSGLTASYAQVKQKDVGGAIKMFVGSFAAAGLGLLGGDKLSEMLHEKGVDVPEITDKSKGEAVIDNNIVAKTDSEGGQMHDWIGIRTSQKSDDYYNNYYSNRSSFVDKGQINSESNNGISHTDNSVLPESHNGKGVLPEVNEHEELSEEATDGFKGRIYQGGENAEHDISSRNVRYGHPLPPSILRAMRNHSLSCEAEAPLPGDKSWSPDQAQQARIEEFRAKGWEKIPNSKNLPLRLIAVIDCRN